MEEAEATAFGVVVIASSAGGITALPRVLGPLPAVFPVPIVIVQHLPPNVPSSLVHILIRTTRLRVRQAVDGTVLCPGTVDVAPPGHHLLIRAGGVLTLNKSEVVHHVRPSADILFASAAAVYGSHTVGVVLSGTGSDGADGCTAIHLVNGTVVVQDRATAEFTGMPDAALATGMADYVVPLDDIAALLVTLVGGDGALVAGDRE